MRRPHPARRSRRLTTVLALGIAAFLGASRSNGSTPTEMMFTRLGAGEGLAQGAVRAIAQDRQGFMWFGTEDGLDRYDGYELRHFIHNHSDPGTLPNNWVASLINDSAGRLWVATDGGGLVWRDPAKGGFVRPDADHEGRSPESGARIRSVFEDRQGRIWMATRGSGLLELDADRRHTHRFVHLAGNPNSISDDSVFALAQDPAGRIWIGTASGLDRLDPESGRIEPFVRSLQAAGIAAATGVKVQVLHADARGGLWIGAAGALARWDIATATLSVLRHRDGDPLSLPDGQVTAVLEDDAQRFWVGTTAGLALLDLRNEHFAVVRHDPTDPASLPDDNITALFQDRSGLLWIGTKTGGLACWNPRSWSFGHHRFGAAGADAITSFVVDRRGTLWIGSFGAGVVSIDRVTAAERRYRRDPHAPLGLSDDTVMAIATDEQDRVWLGTMSGGIDRIDAARHAIRHFASNPADPQTLPAPGIMSLLRDSRGRIWVGTYGGGVAMIDPATDRIQRYPGGGGDHGLSSDRATALAEDRAGLIWIGTDGGGLDVLDPASGRFAHFRHDAADSTSLGADTVYALHVDDSGTVWVGSRGGGMDRVRGAPFADKTLRFENLSESEGLSNSTVYGIESDAAGTLWLSTNRGLSAVHPGDRTVRSFRRSHGLQADEFNFGAHYRAADGTLYFGGANGYNAFRPEFLQTNPKAPPVVLTGVVTLNTRAAASPELLHRVNLGFRDPAITFQFAALDFAGPNENRYAYRLDGFDTDWIDAGGVRQATYTHLDGGDYVFRVRAANNDGRWTETPLAVQLHVDPPPWATWWARSLYGIAAALLLWLIWWSQHRRVRREVAYARRLQHEVDVRTAELAERNRDMERAYRQLREVSVSDSLTGLGNRRRLHEAMTELAASTVGGRSRDFVLMVVDLDHLKPINDQFGHEGGDAVLMQVADILRREVRAGDLIVRWGGDEFVVLSMEADLQSASLLAERIRSAVAKQIFRVSNGRVARTSCSIGFAAVPFVPDHPELLDWQQTLSIADLALYHAKHDRNTWVGWRATEKALQFPSIIAALSADPITLEHEGYLVVRRRPWNPEETVDRMRAPRWSK